MKLHRNLQALILALFACIASAAQTPPIRLARRGRGSPSPTPSCPWTF